MNPTETSSTIEPAVLSEAVETWNQQRTDDELREFLAEIEVRAANIETSKNRLPFSFLRTINF